MLFPNTLEEKMLPASLVISSPWITEKLHNAFVSGGEHNSRKTSNLQSSFS